MRGKRKANGLNKGIREIIKRRKGQRADGVCGGEKES